MALEKIYYYPENEGTAKTFRDIDTQYWYYEYELVSLIGKEKVESIKEELNEAKRLSVIDKTQRIEQKFRLYLAEEKCKSCCNENKVEKCNDFDECCAFEREYFFAGYKQHEKDISTK